MTFIERPYLHNELAARYEVLLTRLGIAWGRPAEHPALFLLPGLRERTCLVASVDPRQPDDRRHETSRLAQRYRATRVLFPALDEESRPARADRPSSTTKGPHHEH